MRLPEAADARLAVTIGPADVAALLAIADGKPRTEAARALIQKLVDSPVDVRDALAAQPPIAIPKKSRTRLDVRLPFRLHEQFVRWCAGRVSLGDALRAAIRAEKLGALTPKRANRKRRRPQRKATRTMRPPHGRPTRPTRPRARERAHGAPTLAPDPTSHPTP